MPRKRIVGKRRLDQLTAAQRSHLESGHYFFDFAGEADHFADEDHRLEAWRAHRDLILAEWCHPGQRPVAMWEYDLNLRPQPWPKGWGWPRPIQTESEMVHALLQRGEIAPCRFNGCVPIKSELAQIEHDWLREIGWTVGCRDELPVITRPLTTYGTPVWFARRHARRIWERARAEIEAWYARRSQPTGAAANGS